MASERKRVSFRVDPAEYERIRLMADKRGMSIDEFIRYSVSKIVDVELGAVEVDNIIVARLNQVLNEVSLLATAEDNLRGSVENLGGMLIAMARGDSYLDDREV